MSGHSKWSSIKHKKGAADAKRGKLFTKLARAITVAARDGGGNPGGNPTLALAVQRARRGRLLPPYHRCDDEIYLARVGSAAALAFWIDRTPAPSAG